MNQAVKRTHASGETRPLASLRPNPLNPRTSTEDTVQIDELAESIRSLGLLQPLVITPDGVVITGHRRRLACHVAGLEEVPVVVRDLDETDQLSAMLAENLARRELNPVETARGCQALRDRGCTLEQVAVRAGMPPTTVRVHLALLTLPQKLQDRCARGELPLSYVHHLCRLPTPEAQIELATEAIAGRWTVERVLRAVEREAGEKPRKYPVAAPPVIAPPKQADATTRTIELCLELTTLFRRQPQLVHEPVVKDWLQRLSASVRDATANKRRGK